MINEEPPTPCPESCSSSPHCTRAVPVPLQQPLSDSLLQHDALWTSPFLTFSREIRAVSSRFFAKQSLLSVFKIFCASSPRFVGSFCRLGQLETP